MTNCLFRCPSEFYFVFNVVNSAKRQWAYINCNHALVLSITSSLAPVNSLALYSRRRLWLHAAHRTSLALDSDVYLLEVRIGRNMRLQEDSVRPYIRELVLWIWMKKISRSIEAQEALPVPFKNPLLHHHLAFLCWSQQDLAHLGEGSQAVIHKLGG